MIISLVYNIGKRSYVGAELEVAHTADDILVMRVIKMAIENFLR